MKRLIAVLTLFLFLIPVSCDRGVTEPESVGPEILTPSFAKPPGKNQSNDGQIVYSQGPMEQLPGGGFIYNTDLYWLDLKTNKPRNLTPDNPNGLDQMADWSPSGDRLVFVRTPGNLNLNDAELWIMEVAPDGTPGAMTRITYAPGAELYPVWSPDGTKIAYTCRATPWGPLPPPTFPHICMSVFNGSTWDGPIPVTSDPPPFFPPEMARTRSFDTRPTWAPLDNPGGEQILFSRQCIVKTFLCDYDDRELWMLTLGSDGAPARVTQTPSINEDNPSWNPAASSSQIAYNVISNVGDDNETNFIFTHTLEHDYDPVMPPDWIQNDPPITTAGTQVTTEGFEDYPSWTPLGDMIFYLADQPTGWDVFRIFPDGSMEKNITNTPHLNEGFAKQRPPIIIP